MAEMKILLITKRSDARLNDHLPIVQGAEVKTDHYLLVGICRLQFRPRQPHRPSKDNSDISSLSDENVWNVYQQKLQNMLSNSQILLCVA
jgi:hypothetical protein